MSCSGAVVSVAVLSLVLAELVPDTIPGATAEVSSVVVVSSSVVVLGGRVVVGAEVVVVVVGAAVVAVGGATVVAGLVVVFFSVVVFFAVVVVSGGVVVVFFSVVVVASVVVVVVVVVDVNSTSGPKPPVIHGSVVLEGLFVVVEEAEVGEVVEVEVVVTVGSSHHAVTPILSSPTAEITAAKAEIAFINLIHNSFLCSDRILNGTPACFAVI